MDWPSLLPSDMDYCRSIAAGDQIIPTLTSHSDEDLVRFFEYAADDETWTQKYSEIMRELLAFLTREFASKRLRVAYGQRVMEAIHKHIEVLRSLLLHDLVLVFKGGQTTGNSLLYGTQSAVFRELIDKGYRRGQDLTLTFADVPKNVFEVVDEYILVGDVSTIYRHTKDMLTRILLRAGQWQIGGLVVLCANVIKRYVDRDSATELLALGQAYALPELKQACCDVLNYMGLGAEFAGGEPTELKVTIEDFKDRTGPMLMEIAPNITHLALREHVPELEEVRKLLPRCARLVSFDLHGSKGFNLDILPLLPRLRELDMGGCDWLENAVASIILQRLNGIKTLILNENPQLTHEGFSHVAEQVALENLNCTYCTNLEDAVLANLARGCNAMVEINISWCPKLTDVGMRSLGSLRPGLKVIDISDCTKVSDAGIHDLVRPCTQLERLSMQHLPLVSEDGILDVVALCRNLKYLDIRLCNITEAGVEAVRQRRPDLEMRY